MRLRHGYPLPTFFWLSVGLLAYYPAPLLPVARLYHALCGPFPVLTALGRMIPPLSLALVFLSIGAAVAAGLLSALGGTLSALRIARGFDRLAAPLPARLAIAASRLDLEGRLRFLATPVLAAFCYRVVQPRVGITAGLLARLDDQELAAVLLHERHHLRRRDPLRYLLLQAAADGFFMAPLATAVQRRVETRMELAADRAALAEVPRGALAGALLAALAGRTFLPAGMAALGATEARIAHLAGKPHVPALPRDAILATMATFCVGGIVAVSLATPHQLWELVCTLCPGLG